MSNRRYGEKYTREILTEAVKNSTSYAGVLRFLRVPISGGAHAHISRRIKQLGINTDHFLGKGHARGKMAPRKTPEEILIRHPHGSGRAKPEQLRRALLSIGVSQHCRECGIDTWHGKPLILHIDHISGDHCDNRRENLRFLCPNCHSQTSTYAGRMKNRKKPVTES